MASRRIIMKLLQPYWRLTRGMTLGAQGIVTDADQRVLLVRHGYRPGWHFPGGGVEWNETLEQALERELVEETGVEINDAPQFHGVFANFTKFPGDHIAVFIVCGWNRPTRPKPTAEIAESAFFKLTELPDQTDAATRRRLAEVFEGRAISQFW